MTKLKLSFLSILLCVCVNSVLCSNLKAPTVVISILVRNKAHTLPYFLTLLGKLNYPKDRIALWIRSDHNIDQTIQILNKWLKFEKSQYHMVDFQYDTDESRFSDEINVNHWSTTRYYHVMNLRQTALDVSRKIWADYVWMLDADVFLTDPDVLLHLVSKNVTIAAPMLKSVSKYSNFWCGMTEKYYYQRTDDYEPILDRKNVSCFEVPMVHSSILVDLRKSESDRLTYRPEEVAEYKGPHDDVIVFAVSAMVNGIAMNICNDRQYGFIMVPMGEDYSDLSFDFEQLASLKMEILTDGEPLSVDKILQPYEPPLPKKEKWGFDKIYMINLLRRPERRKRMMSCFDELGLEVDILNAVDGRSGFVMQLQKKLFHEQMPMQEGNDNRELSDDVLEEIKFLPGYEDPYHKRPMTLGEIGCFLSHYNIWEEANEKGYEKVLVLEDDIRFEAYFRSRIERLMEEVEEIPGWDLIYLGRKRMVQADEPWVSDSLVRAAYSYWTLGYVISRSGIKKLLEADPLSKLLPVDEFLPIMFDRHPEESWKNHFPKRDLLALSAAPLLVYPMRYTGEDGYISDTEDSIVVSLESENIIKTDEFR